MWLAHRSCSFMTSLSSNSPLYIQTHFGAVLCVYDGAPSPNCRGAANFRVFGSAVLKGAKFEMCSRRRMPRFWTSRAALDKLNICVQNSSVLDIFNARDLRLRRNRDFSSAQIL